MDLFFNMCSVIGFPTFKVLLNKKIKSTIEGRTHTLLTLRVLKQSSKKAMNFYLMTSTTNTTGATDGKGQADLSKLKLALIHFGVDPKDVRPLHSMGFEVIISRVAVNSFFLILLSHYLIHCLTSNSPIFH